MIEIQAYKRSISERLSTYYPDIEADQMARLLLQEAYGLPYPKLILSDHKVSEKCAMVEEWLTRLLSLEPIQYVIGHTYFHNMKLMVREGVLIPRGETEQLCQLLTEYGYLREQSVTADVCTGSGAIALYLASHGCQVEAIDVSDLALDVAKENIRSNDYEGLVELRKADILSDNFKALYPSYDLVVSNPPYVLEHERTEIKPHVLEHEPDLALFVPDDDGLRFYEAILHHYHQYLKKGGAFAFEINPLLVRELIDLYSQNGYDTDVIEDYHGRKRFLFATKK